MYGGREGGNEGEIETQHSGRQSYKDEGKETAFMFSKKKKKYLYHIHLPVIRHCWEGREGDFIIWSAIILERRDEAGREGDIEISCTFRVRIA